MRLDHIESPSHLPVDCTGKSHFSSHFTLLHLSDHDDFQPSATCRCFTHRSSESANLKQMKSIYFLQRRLTLRSQGYLNDQLAGSNFSWHQAKVAGAALIYCYLCPRVGTDGTFWQRGFLAGKHPFDWDAHSFTCLKIMCREQTVEKKYRSKAKLYPAMYAISYRPSGWFIWLFRFHCTSKRAQSWVMLLLEVTSCITKLLIWKGNFLDYSIAYWEYWLFKYLLLYQKETLICNYLVGYIVQMWSLLYVYFWVYRIHLIAQHYDSFGSRERGGVPYT